MAFTYRFANAQDLPAIVEIENAAMSCPWSLKSYEEAISSDHSFIMVAEDDGQIAAFSVFYLTPPEAELPDIVVDEKYRGQGLGRQLLSKALEELESRGIDTIFLEVRVSNTPARHLYEGLGFEEIGTRKYFYSDPVEDAICMKLERNI
ncbi:MULTISPECIES: ribosomal protein S18-alanine N-acetyltransferase [Pseudobutyrivibrio]|uniref:[Ribosomal protein bS18]-alanine N-acetyltransferase n=1 Tax=Pseudobutyrivibrio xylanivorans TaxID=185007 RepID=A0A1G5S628_PSEXY|nr:MULTISPECIES: ribosomal protein S18-alanine N-acetyltransferase [Pseudobutyrivibrio]MDC7280413.1 ribosomal protein S18-alanine N-acetyltransferase [Butyrivibrio fibrisolvens]SCZ81537.1 ribosomal-protein-alanine N-acetyltransferase [Pseudobutyrivibrio xylanivorans]